jgi:hypothetical protein
MGQYCDSASLEYNWFKWILASEVPSLEGYRELRILWTKVIGTVKDKQGKIVKKNGNTFPDASSPHRLHCIALANPIFFESMNGVPMGVYRKSDGCHVECTLPIGEELGLDSDSSLHELNDIFLQYDRVVPELNGNGYTQELPVSMTWHHMLSDISKMCMGIATKFNMPTEEETLDLANEALLAVTNKLVKRKLIYTPGLAPVFNLLTTTIYRCMYSIMNRRNSQKNNLSKLLNDVKSGSIHSSQRSFRLPTH